MATRGTSRGWASGWASPPVPDDPELATRWRELDTSARAAIHQRAADPERCRGDDRRLVAWAARRAVERVPATTLVAAGTGLLVLMTVWGFGRSLRPDAAGVAFVVGLALGLVVWGTATLAAVRRARRARVVLDRLSPHEP